MLQAFTYAETQLKLQCTKLSGRLAAKIILNTHDIVFI